MKLTFVGVGSAFDAELTNTSILVESCGKSMLLDCGFNAAHSFVRHAAEPAALDLLWVSHFHGDHFFGIPFLIGYLLGKDRKKPLVICGPCGVREAVNGLVRAAYPNILDKIGFEIFFQELRPGDAVSPAGFKIVACNVDHSQPAMAARISHNGSVIFYSGDGGMLPECHDLASGVDLGILEAYHFADEVKGHSTVKKSVEFACAVKMRNVALVHLDPSVRSCMLKEVLHFLDGCECVNAFFPSEGMSFVPTPAYHVK